MQNRLLQAKDILKRILTITPEDSKTRLELAKLQLIFSDFEEAEANWYKLSQLQPTPDLLIFHGNLLTLKKQLSEAETIYNQALALDQNNQMTIIKLASCFIAQQKTELATQHFSKLITMGGRRIFWLNCRRQQLKPLGFEYRHFFAELPLLQDEKWEKWERGRTKLLYSNALI